MHAIFYKEPDVSVVVPTRDRPRLTKECVQSVLRQKKVSVEVIVIENGHGQKVYTEENVRWFHIQGGACAARNFGMNQSRGRFIKFLDSDDLLEDDVLSPQVDTLESSGADVCYTDWATLSGPHSRVQIKAMGTPEDLLDAMLTGFWVPPLGYLFRREAAKSVLWDEKLMCHQDYDYILSHVLNGARFTYLPMVGGYYRQHDGDRITSTGGAYFSMHRCVVMDKLVLMLRRTGRLTKFRAHRLACEYWNAARWWYRVDRCAFKKCVSTIYELEPMFWPDDRSFQARLAGVLGVDWAEHLLGAMRKLRHMYSAILPCMPRTYSN